MVLEQEAQETFREQVNFMSIWKKS